jgi:hypothetical protein
MQALEALESGMAFDRHAAVLQNLRTALEQPEQEPLAKLFGTLPVTPSAQRKPLTEEEARDLLPTNHNHMTRADLILWVLRATERAHGITGEQT